MKISREGVLLIKSFEGFRPRAVPRAEGGWVIGYGHRASAREGASVSETEAELLLQYDLIPVQAALSGGLTRAINQHQYDALASFAFSVGAEAFQASDVLARINAGEEAEAAEALAAWPERPARDAGLRRRAAERALFVADPAAPVALADLLAAPAEPVAAEADEAAPVVEEPATASDVTVEPAIVAPEPDAPIEDAAEPVAEAETVSSQPAEPAPRNETQNTVQAVPASTGFSHRLMAYATPTFGPLPTSATPATEPAPEVTSEVAPEYSPEEAPAVEPVTEPAAPDAAADLVAAIDAVRNATPASDEEQVASELHVEAPIDAAVEVAVEAQPAETPTEAVADTVLPVFETAPADLTAPPAPIEAASVVIPFETAAPSTPTLARPFEIDGSSEWTPPSVQPPLVLAEPSGDDPFAHAALTSPPPAPAPLEWPALNEDLAGPVGAASTTTPRLVWPREEAAGAFDQTGELNLSASAPAWGDDFDAKQSVFSWKRVWAYVVMGVFGLVSLAVSMAALRKASLASTDVAGILAIAGVLALIGAACVGVSAYNIYQRISDDR